MAEINWGLIYADNPAVSKGFDNAVDFNLKAPQIAYQVRTQKEQAAEQKRQFDTQQQTVQDKLELDRQNSERERIGTIVSATGNIAKMNPKVATAFWNHHMPDYPMFDIANIGNKTGGRAKIPGTSPDIHNEGDQYLYTDNDTGEQFNTQWSYERGGKGGAVINNKIVRVKGRSLSAGGGTFDCPFDITTSEGQQAANDALGSPVFGTATKFYAPTDVGPVPTQNVYAAMNRVQITSGGKARNKKTTETQEVYNPETKSWQVITRVVKDLDGDGVADTSEQPNGQTPSPAPAPDSPAPYKVEPGDAEIMAGYMKKGVPKEKAKQMLRDLKSQGGQ